MANGDDEIPNKNKPSGSAFKQQRLPAWQPILTAGTVLPTFLLIGIAFIPIGIGLLISSNRVQEMVIDYTQCIEKGSANNNTTCGEKIKPDPQRPDVLPATCTCEKTFTLSESFVRDVYVYYGLTNYYQNHRRYVKSRDDQQLRGENPNPLNTDCDPFTYQKETGLPIAPCGAIANSLFNDTILLWRMDKGVRRIVPATKLGIAWATDKNAKFRNPPGDLSKVFEKTASPPNWRGKKLWQLDTSTKPGHKENNGFENEDLIVWMRTAALPTFKKLYARIDHSAESFYNAGLPKGDYILEVQYNYPTTPFKGTKRVIISNTSWLGGKNPFLGIAYIVVGCLCLILSAVFFFIHRKFGKSTSELLNITQRTPYMSS